jgi:hypothetical protein
MWNKLLIAAGLIAAVTLNPAAQAEQTPKKGKSTTTTQDPNNQADCQIPPCVILNPVARTPAEPDADKKAGKKAKSKENN